MNETVTHSICTISDRNSTYEVPVISEYPNFQSDCSTPRPQFVSNLIAGVNLGCALFILNGNCVLPFLDVFYDVHDFAMYRALLKKMLVILDSKENVSTLVHNQVILESLPHTLLILPQNESVDLWAVDLTLSDLGPTNQFRISDWKFEKNEPLLPIISDLKVIELFILKIANAWYFIKEICCFFKYLFNYQGKTVKVAGFSYRPYTAHYYVGPGKGNANMRGSNESMSVYLDGYEFVICQEFCRYFNCVLNLEAGERILFSCQTQ